MMSLASGRTILLKSRGEVKRVFSPPASVAMQKAGNIPGMHFATWRMWALYWEGEPDPTPGQRDIVIKYLRKHKRPGAVDADIIKAEKFIDEWEGEK